MFTVETANILDQSDELSACIMESEIYCYREVKYKLNRLEKDFKKEI